MQVGKYKIQNNADLWNANLRNANLRNANLRNANLRNANLRNANLHYADLRHANLRNADLRNADLRNVDLRNANLRNANLHYADLCNANLCNANLCDAKNIPNYVKAVTQIVPETGGFIAWKKVAGMLVKLQIPASAKRSNATGRKCRANKAKVLKIIHPKLKTLISNGHYGPLTRYTVGDYVYPDKWDEDRWYECSNGIHFFMTRYEAEQWR